MFFMFVVFPLYKTKQNQFTYNDSNAVYPRSEIIGLKINTLILDFKF